uniref:Uncharacterized protein n=1 Tax=Human herpesvirus 1 TaxID=10298 RepID=A0A2Z4H477_HHV1|nr:hypothetical protein [Human alphaherpesvirus 1]
MVHSAGPALKPKSSRRRLKRAAGGTGMGGEGMSWAWLRRPVAYSGGAAGVFLGPPAGRGGGGEAPSASMSANSSSTKRSIGWG